MISFVICFILYFLIGWPVALLHTYLITRFGVFLALRRLHPDQVFFAGMVWPLVLFLWVLVLAVVLCIGAFLLVPKWAKNPFRASYVWVTERAERGRRKAQRTKMGIS